MEINPPRLPQERKEKKKRYNFSAFFVTPTLPAPSGVTVASARLCCLSRVPPAVCPLLLESGTSCV